MTGAGKLSPGPQPVMETRPRSHSRASRAHLLRYAAPTGGEHPQKNSAQSVGHHMVTKPNCEPIVKALYL